MSLFWLSGDWGEIKGDTVKRREDEYKRTLEKARKGEVDTLYKG